MVYIFEEAGDFEKIPIRVFGILNEIISEYLKKKGDLEYMRGKENSVRLHFTPEDRPFLVRKAARMLLILELLD